MPDGRTDYKLLERPGFPEETHFDLKADLTSIRRSPDAVRKDVVAISNRPPGRYNLQGFDDNGNPCIPIGTITCRRRFDYRQRFDGARLGDSVRRCIEGEIHLRAQIHEHTTDLRSS